MILSRDKIFSSEIINRIKFQSESPFDALVIPESLICLSVKRKYERNVYEKCYTS